MTCAVRKGPRRREGMTLVELLVVLAIVGVSAGVVVLGLGSLRRGYGAQTEANRLADRLKLAADEVLVSGRPMAIAWTPGAYRFEGAGTPSAALAEPHRLSDGVRLAGPDGAASALIDPDSAAPPVTFVLRQEDGGWSVRFDGLNAVAAPLAAQGLAG
jgi:general secretion pathway protein H